MNFRSKGINTDRNRSQCSPPSSPNPLRTPQLSLLTLKIIFISLKLLHIKNWRLLFNRAHFILLSKTGQISTRENIRSHWKQTALSAGKNMRRLRIVVLHLIGLEYDGGFLYQPQVEVNQAKWNSQTSNSQFASLNVEPDSILISLQ